MREIMKVHHKQETMVMEVAVVLIEEKVEVHHGIITMETLEVDTREILIMEVVEEEVGEAGVVEDSVEETIDLVEITLQKNHGRRNLVVVEVLEEGMVGKIRMEDINLISKKIFKIKSNL